MNLGEAFKRLEKLVVDNSPTILTAIGVTGTLTTAYLTGRASIKAAEILIDAETRLPGRELTSQEKVRLVWKLYIPAVGTAVVTIAAIIGANRIGTRRAAALAAAYSVSEKAFEEYRTKVIEKLGERKEEAVRDEIAQDRVKRDPVDDRTVIVSGRGEVLCYEAYTGRYFKSDMETLRKAENDINRQVIHDGFASLGDFYDLVGLPKTSVSDEIGWTSEKPLEIHFSSVLSNDNIPCISIEYRGVPIRHFDRFS